MKKYLLALMALVCALVVAGIYISNKGSSTPPKPEVAAIKPAEKAPTTKPSEAPTTKPSEETAQINPSTSSSTLIPPGNPLSKIKVGMTEGEVTALIGQPSSSPDVYATGKAWIPGHTSGSDDIRKAYHYKGNGIIIFSIKSTANPSYSVFEIDYDPNEPGYSK